LGGFHANVDGARRVVTASDRLALAATAAGVAELSAVAVHPIVAARVVRFETAALDLEVAALASAIDTVVTLPVVAAGTPERDVCVEARVHVE
jgi:hypothetical protein